MNNILTLPKAEHMIITILLPVFNVVVKEPATAVQSSPNAVQSPAIHQPCSISPGDGTSKSSPPSSTSEHQSCGILSVG